MRVSEVIYNDPKCVQYAKYLGGNMWEDFFMSALEKIINLENKGRGDRILKNYKSYFYCTLLSVKTDYYRRESKLKQISHDLFEFDIIDLEDDESVYFEAFDNFLDRDYSNEQDQVAQIVAEMLLYNTKKQIAKDTGYSLRLVYVYSNRAKELIRDEYNRIMAS